MILLGEPRPARGPQVADLCPWTNLYAQGPDLENCTVCFCLSFSLAHFCHLSQNCFKTRRNRFHKSIFSDIMTEFIFQSMIEKKPWPVLYHALCKYRHDIISQTLMRHILCFHTKHNTPMLLLKELATKHNVMFERLILKFNRNILGRNFTDRYELADICRFTAVHRFAQQHSTQPSTQRLRQCLTCSV